MIAALLSILIFLPIGASLAVTFLPGEYKVYRFIALGTALLQLIIALSLYLNFVSVESDYSLSAFQFVEKIEWFNMSVAGFGIISADYFLGIDGLGLSMVLLSVIVLVLATVSSWHYKEKAKGYFALLLLLNGAIIGCFVALDFLLFYLFFEFMLLPMYFLIGLWGGPRRDYASIKFFLYTLLGSIFILIVLISLNLSIMDPAKTAVQLQMIESPEVFTSVHRNDVQILLQQKSIPPDKIVHTFNLIEMSDVKNIIPGSILDVESSRVILGYPVRLLAFLLVFVGFAIKLPIVPFHTWLPDAHVEAPTAISVILAGVLLKVGGYGLIRVGVLIFPDGVLHYSWLLGSLGVLSIIYGAMNALSSKDLKRLIAYSSVSHMGFVLLGIAASNVEGMGGAVYQMVSHGFISAALFLTVGVLYDRTHDRSIENYSGLAKKMPNYTVFVVIFFFASIGLPGFSGFIAEVFVLLGSFSSQWLPNWMMITASLGLVLSAGYYLWTIQRMFFGPLHVKKVSEKVLLDLGRREYSLLIPLVFLTLLLGIFPDLVFSIINQSVISIIDVLNNTGLQNLNQIPK